MPHRTSMRFFKSSLRTLVFSAMVVGLGSGAGATTVGNAQLVLGLDGGTQQIVNLIIRAIVNAGTGARGAAVAAAVKTDKDMDGANTSFFGDTGLLDAVVSDSTGAAQAFARNKLRGKVNRAGTSGLIASARSVLTWKGQVVWEAPVADLPDLPDASEVVSAQLNVDYAIEDTDVLVSAPAGSGSWIVEHAWNGQTSFLGGVGFDENAPDPVFSGDLVDYSAFFSAGPGMFSATGLILSDVAGIQIDYGAFVSSGSVSASFEGMMEAKSAIVPLPAALPMLAVGLGFLGLLNGSRRRSRV